MQIYETFLQLRQNFVVEYRAPISGTREKSRPSPLDWLKDKSEFKYSNQAQSRFNKICDNFCNMYLAADKLEPSLLAYTFQKRTYKRMPVFCTLTMPVQEASDKDIKSKVLNNFLKNLIQNYGLKTYIWKAESQTRGVIHFHLVFDVFIYERTCRRLWFNGLQRLNCIPAGLSVKSASRLVWLKRISDPATISLELSAYFEGNRDESGNLHHKHTEGLRVRDIQGRSWGCSDTLRYPPHVLYGFGDDVKQQIESQCLLRKEIKDDKENLICVLYFFSFIGRNKDSKKMFKKSAPKPYDDILMKYHHPHAQAIYA